MKTISKIKFILLSILFILCNSRLFGQEFLCEHESSEEVTLAGSFSENGYGHTPSGNLHMMMVYVTFLEDDNITGTDAMSWLWPKNNVPIYQMDLGGYSQFIDFDVNQPSNTNNLTTWYKTMSMVKDANGVPSPKFSITASVFQVQILKDTFSMPAHDPSIERMKEYEREYCKRAMLALANKYPNQDWSKFDNRQNIPNWVYNNSTQKSNGQPAGGDGIIDYLTFTFRFDKSYIEKFTGRAGFSMIDLFSSQAYYNLDPISNMHGTFSFNVGHTSLYAMDYQHAFPYLLHEFGHNLYNAKHCMGANSAAGIYLYQQNGWGMMGNEARAFLTANSWEKYYLGWAQPREITPQTITQSGIYTIDDFINGLDALKIKLPYTQWSDPNQASYLYIENHQMSNYFDNKFMYNEEAPMSPRLYMFITGAESKTRFNTTINGKNHMKVLSAKGSWDFSSTVVNGSRVFQKSRKNPIGGQTQSQLIRGDYDGNGKLKIADEGNDLNEGAAIENLNGIKKMYYSMVGDEGFDVGDEIGMNIGVPITNYPTFSNVTNNYVPNDYYLQGLSIKVISYNSFTKQYTVAVSYNDYDLETSTRFAGGVITLNNLSKDNNPDIVVKQGKILTIDKTNTINTNGENTYYPSTFFAPTTLKCLSGSKILVESYATISARDESKIILNNNASIELQNHSTLVLADNSSLELKSGANLIAFGDAKIIIESGSELIFNSSANINLADVLTRIELKDGGKIRIGDNSVFTWSGNGFLKINTATVGTVNIIGSGNNAKFYKKGTGALYSQKLIEVVGGGSLSVDKSLTEFRIELGKVVLDNNCLVDVESKMVCHGVKFTTPSAGLKHKGIMVYGQQNTPYLTSSTVENAQWGFMCYNNSGTANKASLLNCKFINNDLGVYINGKGADINNCTFWHNKYGAIHLDMMTLTSKLNYVNIYNNNNYPILATGTNFGLVSITNSGIYNNNSTGVYASYTTLGAGCSNISNNFDGNNLTGRNIIMAEQSVMAQEPALWPNVGNNYFFNSIGDGVITNDVKRLYLNKGNNHYQVTNGWEIYGTMPKQAGTKPAYPVVRADQNYWDLAGNAAVNRLQYWVKYEYPTSGTWRDLMITDNTPLSSPPTFSACGSGGIGSLPGTGIDNTPSILIGKPTLLLSDGKNIKDVFSQGLYDLYVDNNSLSALNNFASIANHNYSMTNNIMHCGRLTNEYAIWFEVVYTSYQKMLECLNQGISSGMIGTYQTSPYAYNLIDNTQQNLLSRTNNAGDYDYEVAVGLNLDNSILYKLEGKLEECKQKLLNLRDNEPHTSINEKLIAYTLCNVEKELQFRNHEIAKPNLRDMLFDCQSNLGLASTNDDPIGGTEPDDPNYTEYLGKTGGPIFNPFATIQAEINREYEVIKVYPNPTKGILKIYSENSKIIKIKVWDMSGKLVLEENETTQLNIANRGVYLISITTEKSTQIRKIFVE